MGIFKLSFKVLLKKNHGLTISVSFIFIAEEAARTFKIIRSEFPESKLEESRSICPKRIFCIGS